MRCESILHAIGGTPLVRLRTVPAPGSATVYAKLEGRNPTGSVKVRAALGMVRQAEADGRLRPGGVLVESSSGNMAVALAMVAAALGYQMIAVIDPRTTPVNRAMLRAYGARTELVTEPDAAGGYQTVRLARARELARSLPTAVLTYQYGNPANPRAHAETTGPEILRALGGAPDCVVAGVSSGGQVSGIGRVLRPAGSRVCAADTVGSSIFGARWAPHLVRGVGLSWTPENLDPSVVDEAYAVPDELSFAAARLLAAHEGILAGGSSGLVLAVALATARELGPGRTVVAVLADRGEKYLDQFYDDRWCAEHGLDLAGWDLARLRTEAAALRPVGYPAGEASGAGHDRRAA
ncbi:MAG TPA: cysteine synthase family protein [Mycobacteriales bacterium]|nr:cysteine synthase family protein [Mycobacteriales bacterium]